MGRRCVVGGCGNVTTDNISVHRFPKEEQLQRKWIYFVSSTRPDFVCSEDSVICSEHFTEDCFDPSSQLKTQFGLLPSTGKIRRGLLCGKYPTILSRNLIASSESGKDINLKLKLDSKSDMDKLPTSTAKSFDPSVVSKLKKIKAFPLDQTQTVQLNQGHNSHKGGGISGLKIDHTYSMVLPPMTSVTNTHARNGYIVQQPPIVASNGSAGDSIGRRNNDVQPTLPSEPSASAAVKDWRNVPYWCSLVDKVDPLARKVDISNSSHTSQEASLQSKIIFQVDGKSNLPESVGTVRFLWTRSMNIFCNGKKFKSTPVEIQEAGTTLLHKSNLYQMFNSEGAIIKYLVYPPVYFKNKPITFSRNPMFSQTSSSISGSKSTTSGGQIKLQHTSKEKSCQKPSSDPSEIKRMIVCKNVMNGMLKKIMQNEKMEEKIRQRKEKQLKLRLRQVLKVHVTTLQDHILVRKHQLLLNIEDEIKKEKKREEKYQRRKQKKSSKVSIRIQHGINETQRKKCKYSLRSKSSINGSQVGSVINSLSEITGITDEIAGITDETASCKYAQPSEGIIHANDNVMFRPVSETMETRAFNEPFPVAIQKVCDDIIPDVELGLTQPQNTRSVVSCLICKTPYRDSYVDIKEGASTLLEEHRCKHCFERTHHQLYFDSSKDQSHKNPTEESERMDESVSVPLPYLNGQTQEEYYVTVMEDTAEVLKIKEEPPDYDYEPEKEYNRLIPQTVRQNPHPMPQVKQEFCVKVEPQEDPDQENYQSSQGLISVKIESDHRYEEGDSYIEQGHLQEEPELDDVICTHKTLDVESIKVFLGPTKTSNQPGECVEDNHKKGNK